jgi:iron transport multicopper oxidase
MPPIVAFVFYTFAFITTTTASHMTVNITEKYHSFSTGTGRVVQVVQDQDDAVLMAPPMFVDEDELITTTVRNLMYSKSLTIHHHGLHQHGTPWMDGVPGLSQTLISTGETYVYKFLAHPAGTHFYHTHVAQLGLRGPFIVKAKTDPHRSLYDTDENVLLFSDFSKSRDESTWLAGLVSGLLESEEDPESDLAWDDTMLLINGVAVDQTIVTISSSKNKARNRFRLINGAFNWALELSIEEHSFLVIASDGKDCVPQLTTTLVLSPGERYDIILRRNALVTPPRTSPQGYAIHVRTRNNHRVTASLRYNNDAATGANAAKNNYPLLDYPLIDKIDLSYNTTLLQAHPASTPLMPSTAHQRIDMKLGGTMKSYEWTINGKKWSLNDVNLKVPLSLLKGLFTPQVNANILNIPLNNVVDIQLTNPTMMQHPFHIHGHKFWVVRSRPMADTTSTTALPTDRPMFKDTINIPPSYRVTLRVLFDNPGPWLFHCHTSFHLNRGMAVVFMVGNAQEQPIPPNNLLNNQCSTTKSVTDGGTVAYTSLYIVSIVLLVVGFISGYAVGCVKCANKNPYTVVDDSSPVPSPTSSTSSLGNGPVLSPLQIETVATV